MKYLLLVGTWSIDLPGQLGKVSCSIVSSFKNLTLEEIGSKVIQVQDDATNSLIEQCKNYNLKGCPGTWSTISIQIADYPGDGGIER